ncbi:MULTISPECIES: glycosyltransferase family 2 protein [Cellulosimicrobium]|uniref:glycosyltransferase family 2 protein n=1 Tax=Cellulosimicrobium TaxID=157920 RepID=UPI00040D7A19|nr:glycosyltransferase family 2 protein [Cellulosimicrobium sp. JZ28]
MPSPSPRGLLLIIPAWNEQEALPGVLREVREVLPEADVVVVNDGSSDHTALVAARCGVEVLDLPANLGVGGAMRAGYKFALRRGYEVAVQLDADGQHDPREVAALLRRMEETGADLVIGARFAGVGTYTARGPRRWSMRLLSGVLSRVTRTRLTDTTSGFKASNRRAIRLFASNYPAEYLGDTVEAIVIATRAGLRIEQQGVEMRPRAGGTPSHGPVRAAAFLLRAVVALVVALTRPTEPLEPEPLA